MKILRLPLILSAMALGTAAFASDPVQTNNSNTVWFENWGGLTHGMMRVASPDGEINDVYTERGTPVYNLKGNPVQDGVYRYELRASTEEMIKNRDYNEGSSLNGDNEEFIAKQLYRTGSFFVERGRIVQREVIEESKESE